jgi:hypothetical protein
VSRRDSLADALVASTTLTAQGYSGWTAATKQDPGSLETAALTEANGRVTITVGNAAVVSGTPDIALTYTVPILGLDGRAATINPRALCRWLVAAFGAPGSNDLVLMAGLSAGGPPTSGRRGVAVGMISNAGNWQCLRTQNAGATSWSAWTAAVSTSASTRMALGALGPYSSWQAAAYFGAGILDSAGDAISLANGGASINNLAFGLTPNWDYFFVGAGWSTGAGGTPGAYALAARLGAMSLSSVSRMVPT